MLKKIFSILVISLFVISLIPTAAFAFEPIPASEANAPGGSVTTPEELMTALGGKGMAYENGVITLVRDIVLASSVNITSGAYIIVGEGATIKGVFDGDLFVVTGEGTTLTLGDRNATENKSDLIFDDGNNVREGSLFRVEHGGKLEMYNSVIIKNATTSRSGAAIYNEGEFTMYGGEIENCRASSSGGAIYNAGTLTLAAGYIKNCFANDGGAVFTEKKSTFIATSVSNCKATNGGAVYNMGEMQFLSATITECSAAKGGAVYNGGKAVIKGGTINNNKAENGEGGGIYNSSELELSGSVIHENLAKNGGNVYNSGNASTGENFALTSGNASEKGGNIYNSELGIFTQSSGSVNLGKAVYGGGVYNLGTYNLSGGGVYANKAQVADGILNHGKVVLSGMGYCEKGDDIFVVLTEENKHAIVVAENWSYKSKLVSVSSGTFKNGGYSYSHSTGDKILDIKGSIDAGKRFMLHISDTGLVLKNDGTLAKAPAAVSETLVTAVCIIFAYPLVTAAIVFVIRYFDKKKLCRQTEIK